MLENKIKHFRKIQGVSQLELAELCNVSRQTINAIENQKYSPSLILAFKIAFSLNISILDVFYYEEM